MRNPTVRFLLSVAIVIAGTCLAYFVLNQRGIFIVLFPIVLVTFFGLLVLRTQKR
jgi:hypothetical protein